MMTLMQSRQDQLVLAYDGLMASHAPLVRLSGGTYGLAGASDDLGLYLVAPYLAKWFSIDVVLAAQLLLSGIVIVAAVFGVAGAIRMCRTSRGRAYAVAAYAVLAGYAVLVGDVYVVSFAVPAAFIPWVIIVLPPRANPRQSAETLLFVLGTCGWAAHVMRSHAATAVFLGAAILVIAADTSAARKIRMVAALALGITVVYGAMAGVYAARDGFLAETDTKVDVAIADHPFWHSVYIGFGYTENPYVPEYLDEVAMAQVASVDPTAVYLSDEYESILRDSVFDLARDHPGFVAHSLGVRTARVAMFLFFFWGYWWLPNVGLLGLLRKRPDSLLLWVFAVMLGFQALFGILVVPEASYLTGFAVVAGILGIVTADEALSPDERLTTGLDSAA